MKFTNSELELSFEVPDTLTARVLLRYDSALMPSADNASMFERMWQAAAVVVQQWSCPLFGIDVDLDSVVDGRVLEGIKFTGISVFNRVTEARQVPKN